MAHPDTSERDVYTVSRLNQEVKLLLESGFPLLWVEGEISNLARPRSGHIYFSLKDGGAQVRCAMFRNRNLRLRFRPDDGTQVMVRARVSLYTARGEFQLIVEHMEPAGDGALRRAFEQLKARLDREGLFDQAHKRPLPERVRRLGVITSPTGAAVRDVLHVLQRRFPAMAVVVYPVPVQGEGAAERIAARITEADARDEVDALLLTRGGGSLEDLWAFNEETLARAVHACRLPIVSAVGHEVDVTIADLVADQRAPTPSAGAEMLSPDGRAWLRTVGDYQRRLADAGHRVLTERRRRLESLRQRLHVQHPGRRLQERAQRLDELEQRLASAQRRRLHLQRERLAMLATRLREQDPRRRVHEQRLRADGFRQRLRSAMTQTITHQRNRLQTNARALQAVSPLATLERGYTITQRTATGELLRSACALDEGDCITTRLHQGEILSRVERIRAPGDESILGASRRQDGET